MLPGSVAAQQKTLKEQLVGKWQKSDGSGTMTFLKDGTFTLQVGPFPLTGTFSTPDEKHLKIEVSGIAGNLVGTQVRDAEIKDGKLILLNGGNREGYTRQP